MPLPFPYRTHSLYHTMPIVFMQCRMRACLTFVKARHSSVVFLSTQILKICSYSIITLLLNNVVVTRVLYNIEHPATLPYPTQAIVSTETRRNCIFRTTAIFARITVVRFPDHHHKHEDCVSRRSKCAPSLSTSTPTSSTMSTTRYAMLAMASPLVALT